MVSKNLILSDIYCTKLREARLTADLISGKRCVVWRHTGHRVKTDER
jgi:hypothetical protein